MLTFDLSSKVVPFELLYYHLNIFFSETNGLIQFDFHIECPLDETILIWLKSHDQNGCQASSLEPKGQIELLS